MHRWSLDEIAQFLHLESNISSLIVFQSSVRKFFVILFHNIAYPWFSAKGADNGSLRVFLYSQMLLFQSWWLGFCSKGVGFVVKTRNDWYGGDYGENDSDKQVHNRNCRENGERGRDNLTNLFVYFVAQ